ncbi:MAG: TadE family protein [Rickettsiales bacterium]
MRIVLTVFSISTQSKKNFASDSDGVTAVEFALITPVFMLLLFGIIEFALVMFVSSVMEGAVAASSRYGKTGYTAAGSSRQEQITSNIATRTAGLLDPAKITVSTTVYPSFDSISQEEPYIDTNHNVTRDAGETYTDVNGNGQWDSAGVVGLGNANDIVVYTVYYPWVINTPIIGNFFGNTVYISSRTVVKNEPY